MSSLLFIFSKPPHGSVDAQEGLDALLMGSAFAECSVLFVGDGILQLVSDQDPEPAGFKNFALSFGALADYGVHNVACSRESLDRYNLSVDQLVIGVTVMDADAMQAMIKDHGKVLNF